jgi:hypothetical protein
MSRTIELPDAVYVALDEAARASGKTPADWIAAHLSRANGADNATALSNEDWLDRDFLKTYAQESDEAVSLESVRHAMAKIPGRLVDDIRAERDES